LQCSETRFRGIGQLSLSTSWIWIIAPAFGKFSTCFFLRNSFTEKQSADRLTSFSRMFDGSADLSMKTDHLSNMAGTPRRTSSGQCWALMTFPPLDFKAVALQFLRGACFHCFTMTTRLCCPKATPSHIILVLLPKRNGLLLFSLKNKATR